jgi:hypothetical protein
MNLLISGLRSLFTQPSAPPVAELVSELPIATLIPDSPTSTIRPTSVSLMGPDELEGARIAAEIAERYLHLVTPDEISDAVFRRQSLTVQDLLQRAESQGLDIDIYPMLRVAVSRQDFPCILALCNSQLTKLSDLQMALHLRNLPKGIETILNLAARERT